MGNQTSQDKSGRRKSKTYNHNGGLNSPDGCSIEVHGSAIEDVRPTVERPPFTKEQKELVTKTWQILHEDMAKVGIVMFIGLFETRPDAKELFVPFKHLSSEDMKHSAHLRAHAMRVMGTVEKCLARIDEPEKLDELLHALGRRHSVYNVKSEFVDLIGPQFVRAIEPSLQEYWTPKVEDAWLSLFKLASVIMQETMIS